MYTLTVSNKQGILSWRYSNWPEAYTAYLEYKATDYYDLWITLPTGFTWREG